MNGPLFPRDGTLTLTDAGPYVPNYGGNAKQRRVRRRLVARMSAVCVVEYRYEAGDFSITDVLMKQGSWVTP